jgi:hypothetical protein
LEERAVLEYELVGTVAEDAAAESGAPSRHVTRVGIERLSDGRYRLIIHASGDVQLQRFVREQMILERLRTATDL